MEVVRMARIVPIGMERWASFKSPERLEPAMIPEQTQKNIKKLNHMAVLASVIQSGTGLAARTSDRGEEDAHQQGEGGGDVSKHVGMMGGCWRRLLRGPDGTFLHHVSFAEVGAPQVLCQENIHHSTYLKPISMSCSSFYVEIYLK